MIGEVEELSPVVGTASACRSIGIPRSTIYRRRRQSDQTQREKARKPSPRRLSDGERKQVLDTLHSDRFIDSSPAEVYNTLLDEEEYLCSERTMYRIMEESGENRERRNQLTHPAYTKPELIATGPNEVWSWDITKLKGPAKWTYFYLYVILDIFSRYTVGWMVAFKESATLARRLITETCDKQDITQDELTLHADRGSSMRSKLVAQLLGDLGVTKSHSRPYTSNDNPFSESQFKTMKYRPEFPAKFGSIEDARTFCRGFFDWYNNMHRHSGIGMMTPEVVHYGQAGQVISARQKVLTAAYESHPERFVRGEPNPQQLPEAVWINPPEGSELMLTN